MIRALVVLLLALMLAGCGGDDDTTTQVRAYWLLNGKVWPEAQEVPASDDPVSAALGELLEGPSDEDPHFESGTAIPSGTMADELQVEDGVASVLLSSELSDAALAQVVFTLTQFPTVESVEIDGESYTRADFEDQTPSVLVESPLPFEEVTSPLRVTGTANTFEATFQYELLDPDGEVVDENFVTATSGTGTRGTFDFTTGPFDEIGALRVFELSAKDGSRLNVVEIPLGTPA